ncbi:unnamed protein product, partial [Rotaria magnacalcarata]
LNMIDHVYSLNIVFWGQQAVRFDTIMLTDYFQFVFCVFDELLNQGGSADT